MRKYNNTFKSRRMKKLTFTIILAFLVAIGTTAQKKIVHLPDLPGYVTLKCDFHMHTVFSDGDVWPTVRVDEAVRAGLDAIAITDHLEYSPKKDYVPLDFNAGWKIAGPYAAEKKIILVHATEITKGMPPGHFNAFFINDAKPILRDSAWDAIAEAVKQGAFIQWNHPGWKAQEPDGIPKLHAIHRKLLAQGWINGIELFNDVEYYPTVFNFSKQFNLTMTGNSDVHGLIRDNYSAPEYINRPMTLVFATERSADALKEALFSGRTLVWFRDILAGMEKYARPFFYKCISVSKPYYEDDDNIYFEISNTSDIPFYLINGLKGTPAELTLAANAVTSVAVSKKIKFPLVYDVRNVLTGEKEVLRAEITY
jgi:3',5'-nucleoside bisphosphate phosphatase